MLRYSLVLVLTGPAWMARYLLALLVTLSSLNFLSGRDSAST
jgi:hypothetical protein